MKHQGVSHDAVTWAVRNHFVPFAIQAFAATNPGKTFKRNWHHEAIAYALWQVETGAIKRLLITMPPRSLKSELVSVAWPAYLLGRDAARRFLAISYGEELSSRLARLSRTVITSPFYQKAFPGTKLKRSASLDFETTLLGGRNSTTLGGVVTGRGGDIIVLDDPQKAEDAMSQARRDSAWAWFQNTLLTRLDDKQSGAIVVVQQRLHVDDIAGRLIEAGGWTHLSLPAIAEKDEEIPIGDGRVHARRENDVLHPDREPLEVLMDLKAQMGTGNFSAQYQQSPIPVEGNLIQPKWFLNYDQAPPIGAGVYILQSWDSAVEARATNDYTVCITALIKGNLIYIIDVFRKRILYPEQRQAVINLGLKYKPRKILIESTANGSPLRHDLRALGIQGFPPIIGVAPRGDKIARVAVHSGAMEANHVYLPNEAAWKAEFLDEIRAFPSGKHDDIVDALSQLMTHVQQGRNRMQTLGFAELIDKWGTVPSNAPSSPDMLF